MNSIPRFAYTHIADIISPTIAFLINESVKEGVFSQCLKITRVIPIYKSDKKILVETTDQFQLNLFFAK